MIDYLNIDIDYGTPLAALKTMIANKALEMVKQLSFTLLIPKHADVQFLTNLYKDVEDLQRIGFQKWHFAQCNKNESTTPRRMKDNRLSYWDRDSSKQRQCYRMFLVNTNLAQR